MLSRLLNHRHRLFAAAALLLTCTAFGCSSDSSENARVVDEDSSETDADGTNPQQPHPAGSAVDINDWQLTFSGLQPDVTEDLVAADPYASVPQPGYQFAMFTIDATYTGSGSSGLWEHFVFGIWVDNAFYMQCPATTPNSVYLTPEVSSGGSVSGTLCVEVPNSRGELIAYAEILPPNDEEHVFFALSETDPEDAPTDGTSSQAPLPAGSTVTIGVWSVTVSNLRINAFDEVAEHNAPEDVPEGHQLLLYNIEGTYSGPDIAALAFEVDAGVWYEGRFYAEGCLAYVPNYIADAPDVENGGTVSGTACAEIPNDITDASELLFYITMPETTLATMYFVATG